MNKRRQWHESILDAIDGEGLLRQLKAVQPISPVEVLIGGRRIVLFSSNDYLGLSAHPRVIERTNDLTAQFGMGPRGASLLCGYTTLHEELEQRLAEFKGTEAALLFPTGYMANVGILQALGGPEAAIFSDELNHASIIDGCRLSRSDVHVYRHCDMEHLESLLCVSSADRRIIVSDALFSMDGDSPPLADIVQIRNRYGCLLVLDEAHSTLLYGRSGKGLAEQVGVADQVDVQMGTLSKAFGSLGGYAATSGILRELLVNRARSFVFTTALPVPCVAAAMASLEAFQAEPQLRENLRSNLSALHTRMREASSCLACQRLANRNADPDQLSPIVPIIVGEAESAIRTSDRLFEDGFHVPAIRPPTVPQGTSRLRISLTSSHREVQLFQLVDSLVEALNNI